MAQNINRILTRPLTKVLLKTPLSPNQVTLLGLCSGLMAGILLGQDSYWMSVAGALFFELYALLDNSDGDIARIKNLKGVFGYWLDIIVDTIVHIWIYVCMSLWLMRHYPNMKPIAILALAAIGISSSLGLLAYLRGFSISPNPEAWRESPQPRNFLEWSQLNCHNENFALLLLAVILLRLKVPFLWASAIGGNIFWVRVLVNHRDKFLAVK